MMENFSLKLHINSYLHTVNNSVDNNRHLSTTYSQDTHRYKHGKIDIFRRLSTLFTTFIIIVIIINKKYII